MCAYLPACECMPLPLCVKHPYSSFIRFTRVLCVLTSLQARQLTGGVNIDTLLIYFCLDKWPPKAGKWMCETQVLLLSEWYLFIYLEEMESLSGRVNEMSDRKSC